MEQLTPTQERYHQERVQRLQRIANRAVPDSPIEILSASQRSALSPTPRRADPAPAVKQAQVEFSFPEWLAEQERRHLFPRRFLEDTRQIINDRIKALHPEPTVQRLERIQLIVARAYDLSRNELLSHRRTQDVVLPRQIAMYLCKNLSLQSLPEIGRRFGNRDHTTILHAVRKIEAMATRDETFALELAGLIAEINEVTA